MTTVKKTFNVYVNTKNIVEDDETLYIEGIANTGQKDLVGDIVTETALKQIVEQAPQRNLHYNHESGKKDLLGRIVESELRPEGAWIKTRILREQKNWLQSYIDQGILFGQSISGCCTYEEGSYDEIISWDLTEISLTDTPCDPATMGTVAISKSFDDLLLTLKNNGNPREDEKMADETFTTEDVISIVNDAINERRDEFLETIRADVGKEYDVKLNELSEQIGKLEGQVAALANPEPENQEGEGQENKEPDEEEEKKFQEAVMKATQENMDNFMKQLMNEVNPKYNSNEHAKNRESQKPKSMTARELAEMM